MTHAAPHPADAPTPDAPAGGPGGWARALLEEDLAVLGRLRDAVMAVALALEAQAEGQKAAAAPDAEPPPQPSPPPVTGGDLVLAMHRAARAVRLTCALRARLVEEIDRHDAGQVRRLEDQRAERKARLARLVTRIIADDLVAPDDDADDDEHLAPDLSADPSAEAWAKARESESEAEGRAWLAFEASDRLDDLDRYGDVLERPVSEFIAMICRDLGLAPDWTRLAKEAWAREELRSGKVGQPLAPFAAPPPADEAAPAKRRRRREPPPAPAPSPLPAHAAGAPDPDPPPDAPAPPRERPPNPFSPTWGWSPHR